mmetsp:Transcript_38596/g.70186  ORF Transcript_38596/g.70186 Transcript_38596/m.70186 type:complete len:349 (+) Transcript_38596:74-1120(+)
MAQSLIPNGSTAAAGHEIVCQTLGIDNPTTPLRRSKRWAAGVLTPSPSSPKHKRQKCGPGDFDLSKEPTGSTCSLDPVVVASSSSSDSGESSSSSNESSPKASPAQPSTCPAAIDASADQPAVQAVSKALQDSARQGQASLSKCLTGQQSMPAKGPQRIDRMLGISIASKRQEVAPEEISSSAGEDDVDMTQWSPGTMGMEELQHWMDFFGMKPSRNQGFMVQRLNEVDAFLKGASGKSLARAPSDGVARSPPKRRVTEKGDDLVQLLLEAIRADTDLYERMLMYEPIEVAEVKKRLANFRPDLAGLGEQRLRAFLDAQGVLLAMTGNNLRTTKKKGHWFTKVWRDLG